MILCKLPGLTVCFCSFCPVVRVASHFCWGCQVSVGGSKSAFSVFLGFANLFEYWLISSAERRCLLHFLAWSDTLCLLVQPSVACVVLLA